MNAAKRILAIVLALTLLSFPTAFAAAPKNSRMLELVNPTHAMPTGYVPSDLVNTGGYQVRSAVKTAFERMHGEMSAVIVSGYRTPQKQTSLFNTRLAAAMRQGKSRADAYAAVSRFTAIPGTSEHQLGLAVDFSVDGTLTAQFSSTAAGKWLAAHCHEYGFILRYPTEKSDITKIGFEPWHFRYVGVPHATLMHQNNLCFEEYIETLHQKGHLSLTQGDTTYEVFWSPSQNKNCSDLIDFSSDNAGGYIYTTRHPTDCMTYAKTNWAADSFAAVLGTNFTYPGVIHPEKSISRADYALVLAALLPVSQAQTAFSDVAATDYFAPAVQKVSAAGLMQGSGGRFSPDSAITREAAVTSLARLLPEKDPVWLRYSDTGKIAGWAFQSIQKAVEAGLVDSGEGAFRPADTLTWAEAVTLVSRAQQYLATIAN